MSACPPIVRRRRLVNAAERVSRAAWNHAERLGRAHGRPGRTCESDPATEARRDRGYCSQVEQCAWHERGVLAWTPNRLEALARTSPGEPSGPQTHCAQSRVAEFRRLTISRSAVRVLSSIAKSPRFLKPETVPSKVPGGDGRIAGRKWR